MSEDVLLSQLSELTLNHSVFDQVSPLSDDDIKHLFADVEYVDDEGSNDQLQSDNDQSDEDQSLIEDIASAFTSYSTPHSIGNRPATTFPTAKKWLAAWLKIANLYHCAVTLNPIAPHRMNQMAHIMLPQSASPKAVSCDVLKARDSWSDAFLGEVDRPDFGNEPEGHVYSFSLVFHALYGRLYPM
jgi:hypothetical protein